MSECYICEHVHTTILDNSLWVKVTAILFYQINGTWILKSGTDFRQFSVVTLDFTEDPIEVTIEAVNVTAAQFQPDNELTEELSKYSGKMDDELCKGKCNHRYLKQVECSSG